MFTLATLATDQLIPPSDSKRILGNGMQLSGSVDKKTNKDVLCAPDVHMNLKLASIRFLTRKSCL